MTSDEDYYPSNETSSKGRRRSKRITRRKVRKATATNLKRSLEKSAKELTSQRSAQNSPKLVIEEEATEKNFEKFSGEPLHPAELEQLWRKFKEDGHFRCVPPSAPSPGPKARRKDGKLGAKRAKHRAEATTLVTRRTGSLENNADQELSPGGSDPSSVTLLNPLPNATGSTVHISPDQSRYIPLLPTEEYRNWNKPTIRQNFLSSGTFRETNGLDLGSNGNGVSSFVPQKQLQPMLLAKSRVHADLGGLCYRANNSQSSRTENSVTSVQNRGNRENLLNFYETYPKLGPTYRHNICNSQAGNAAGSLQGRQINSMGGNLGQNEMRYGNFARNWLGCPAANNVSSTNVTNHTLPSSDLTNSHNSSNYFPANLRAHNTELRGVNNFRSSGGFGDNENRPIGANASQNGHYTSFWAGSQPFPKFCSTGNELMCPEDSYNFPVPSSQPLPPMLMNGQNNLANPPTYWMQNGSLPGSAFPGNEVSSSEIPNSTNTLSATTTTSLNEATEVTSINGNETDDSALFIDEISPDVDIRQIVSSFSSYDDDIDYQNYVDDQVPYNENSVSMTMTLEHESNPPPSTTIKTEVRSLYDPSNFSQYNYNPNFENQAPIFHDLETKEQLETPQNHIFLNDSPSA